MYRGCVIIRELACLCRTVCVFSVCYFSILVNTLFCFPEENPNQWHNQFLWRWTSKFRTWHSRKRNLCNDFSYTCISIPCASLIFLKNSSRKFMNLLKFFSYVQYQEITVIFYRAMCWPWSKIFKPKNAPYIIPKFQMSIFLTS